MKRKGLSLLIILGVVFVFAGISTANVPAPPVNQTLGFPDTEFNGLSEADCRGCHETGVPDRHHLLYGSPMVGPGECTLGTCDLSGAVCGGGAPCPSGETCVYSACYINDDCATPVDYCTRGEDCPDFLCEDDLTSCTDDADCVGIGGETCDNACPSYHGVPGECGQPVCLGGSMAPNNPNAGVYGCLTCHDEEDTGGIISFIVYRDCTVCHEYRGGATVHHLDSDFTGAKAGNCVVCHGDLVDNPVGCDANVLGNCSIQGKACATDADCPSGETCVPGTCDHDIPTYAPSLVTPEPAGGVEGSCDFCHDEGHDTASGVEVHNNHDTHHHTGFYYYADGSRESWCVWCHLGGRPGSEPPGMEAYAIRTCENCHGYESLHNIQVDTNGGGVEPGGEDAGYGHIGKDDPGVESDCWGCHGFSTAAEVEFGSGVPGIYSVDPKAITAGADTEVAITGTAFLNGALAVTLTDAADNVISLNAADVTDGSLTTTVNAPAGSYTLQVVKDGEASNAIGIAVVPAVAIASTECADGVLTVTGSGFGDAPPASAADLLNVKMGAASLTIISWSDTEIQAETAACGSTVTVNTLYGSASTGCTGNFDGDEDVDGSDAATFKADFGRSSFNLECVAENLCNGDFDCDGDVDGTDAAGIRADFGRSAFSNACPAEAAATCGY